MGEGNSDVPDLCLTVFRRERRKRGKRGRQAGWWSRSGTGQDRMEESRKEEATMLCRQVGD